jgi:hypothetical protein
MFERPALWVKPSQSLLSQYNECEETVVRLKASAFAAAQLFQSLNSRPCLWIGFESIRLDLPQSDPYDRAMKLIEWRRLWTRKEDADEPDLPLGEDEDPFDEPVVMEIGDVIDLHSIPPKQVKAVVEEYLVEAHARGFRHVRIIHGKGIGAQREMVRKILARTPFVINFHDAPPEAGGLGATMAELAKDE